MEQLRHEPLQRGMQQVGGTQRGAHPCLPGAETSKQEHGYRAERCHADLRDVEEVRSCAQPVERDEQDVPGRRVMTEDLQAADREKAPEVREQPDALVVDAHVEVDGREALVLQVHEDGERDGPDDDRRREHSLRRDIRTAEQPVPPQVGNRDGRRMLGRAGRGAHAAASSHSARVVRRRARSGVRSRTPRRYH
jgi:hypothetical protein